MEERLEEEAFSFPERSTPCRTLPSAKLQTGLQTLVAATAEVDSSPYSVDPVISNGRTSSRVQSSEWSEVDPLQSRPRQPRFISLRPGFLFMKMMSVFRLK